MATSKLLKPTNVTISIPEFTDQPDQRVNSNCIDKEADAINTLSEQIANLETGTSGIGLTRITTDVDSAYPKNYGVGFFVFNGQNVSHAPSTAWFFMIAFRAENSFITQVAFNMTGSNNIYQRQFSVGTTGTSWGKMNA